MGIAQRSLPHRIWMNILFNIGRILSYALAGALIGLLGQQLANYHGNMALALRIAAGIMLILMGLYIAGWSLLLTRFEQQGQKLWRYIQPSTEKLLPVKNPGQALLLGALWGWLPCGLVYSTLTVSASLGSPMMGALFMMCFGLGTLPVLMLTGMAATQFRQLLQGKMVKGILGVSVIAFGIWTIAGMLPHLGHHDHGNHSGHAAHSNMDHSEMDHSEMDHSEMNHSEMDHSDMDHSN
jgi:hypothetical protein